MAVEEYRRAKLATADMELDTAGHGGALPGTYTRELSNGLTSGPLDKFTADAVPHRDEAFVTGGQQPFARITAVDRDSEELVRDLKLNTREMLNFESAGGISGVDIDAADAAKNTEIFDKLLWVLSQPITAKNGIFFPGRRYEFMEWAGTPLYTNNAGLYAIHTLPVKGMNGLTLAGAGRGSTELASSKWANQDHNLFYLEDCNQFTMRDVKVEKHSTQTNGSPLYFKANAADVTNVTIRDITAVRGTPYGPRFVGGSTGEIFRTVWVDSCNLQDASGPAIHFQHGSSLFVQNCVTTGTNSLGIFMVGTDDELSGCRILHNFLGGTSVNQKIRVGITGTYSGLIHKDVTVEDNQLAAGDIALDKVNEWSIVNNKLFNGGIDVDVSGMTTAHNLRLKDNMIDGGVGGNTGILFSADGTTVDGYEISGGRIHNCNRYGITVESDNGSMKRGRIRGVYVLNCSREDSGTTDYSAIRLFEGSAAGSHIGTTVHDNILWTTNATSTNGNKHRYGIEMTNNGGTTDHCLVHDNQVAGWATAAVLLRGANTIANAHDNIDLGAAPIA